MIVFLHFHKAGGSSVVERAEASGYVLPPRHANGHPIGEDGSILRPWEHGDAQLREFFLSLQHAGVDFLALEWGFPRLDILAEVPDVEVWVLVRDPFARAQSNYAFDYANGHTDAKSFSAYRNSHIGEFTRDNYYARAVLGEQVVADSSPETLETLLSQIPGLFANAAVLENRESVERFYSRMKPAVEGKTVPHQKRANSRVGILRRCWRAYRALRRGRLDLVPRQLRRFPPQPDSADWVQSNRLDLAFYAAVARVWCPPT